MKTSCARVILSLQTLFAVANLSEWLSAEGFFGRGTGGPAFLGIYAAVGGVLCLASFAAGRVTGRGRLAGVLAAIIFLGIGVLRIYVGYQAGMRRFLFLIMMMFVGCFFIAVASTSSEDGAEP